MSHTFFVKFRAFKREFLQNHSVYQAQIFRDSWNCYALSIFRHVGLLASSGNDEHMLKRQKNVNKDSPIKVMFILRKAVPGRRVTLPAARVNFSELLYEKKVDSFARANSASGCSAWLRTLSTDDDGSENVAKKMNFRSFKVNLFGSVQYVKCRRLFLELN